MCGCYCYNPFLFWRRPMFCGYPQPGSFLAAARMESAANAAKASLFPYSWYSNYGGEVQVNTYDLSLPLDTVMQLQMVQANPYYVPQFTSPIDYEAQQRELEQLQAQGRAEGLKKGLEIKYRCTMQSLNKFAQDIAAVLKKEGLTDDDKNKLQDLQQKVEALKQKLIQYAQTSSDKRVEEALEDVEAMAGELLELKDIAKELVQTITNRAPEQEAPAQEVDDAVADDEVPTQNPSAVPPQQPGTVQNPDEVADPDAVEDPLLDADGKFKLDNEDLTLEDVKNTYNEYRPQLNEYLKTEGLSDADKQAIINKTKELVAAIKEGKPAKDAAKLYNELIDLVQQSAENINNTANQTSLDQLNTALNGEVVTVVNRLICDPDTSDDNKKAVRAKYREVKAAIKANKPLDEVTKLYNELIELLNKVNENTSKTRIKNAAQICADLYTGANGIDWSGKGEKKIKAAVNKINKYNVLEVMKQWEEGDYNSKTGDECMIDTIKHEFNWSTGEAKKLINHILNCLKDAAKDLNLLEAITPDIATITGEMECSWWDEEKMYNSFNRILAILGVKKVPGEQVQKAA